MIIGDFAEFLNSLKHFYNVAFHFVLTLEKIQCRIHPFFIVAKPYEEEGKGWLFEVIIDFIVAVAATDRVNQFEILNLVAQKIAKTLVSSMCEYW